MKLEDILLTWFKEVTAAVVKYELVRTVAHTRATTNEGMFGGTEMTKAASNKRIEKQLRFASTKRKANCTAPGKMAKPTIIKLKAVQDVRKSHDWLWWPAHKI